MLLGPIFSVELLTSGRRKRYFVLRTGYALVLLLTLWISHQSLAHTPRRLLSQQANLAGVFFASYSQVQLLAVLLVGPALVAGTIAVERERRTIEYLFATDLANGEIVLGKLAARLVLLSYALAVGLPILALAMMLGGIGPDELLAVFTITLSTMVCVSAVSIAASVWSRRVRDALTLAYLLLAALWLAPMYLWLLTARSAFYSGWLAALETTLKELNPVWALSSLDSQRFTGLGSDPWGIVWGLVSRQAVVSTVCAAAAVWGLRRVHVAQAGRGQRRRPRFARRRRLTIGDHPMLWKELHRASFASRLGWIGRILSVALGGLLVAYFVWTMTRSPIGRSRLMAGVAGTTLLGCVALLVAAGRGATAITGEKERDTWITLLSTPLSASEIVWGKFVGVLASLRWLVALIVGLWLLGARDAPLMLVALPFELGVLLVLAAFVVALGLRFSLTASNSTRALALTIGTAVFVGGGFLFCCVPLMVGGRGGRDLEALLMAPVMPLLLAFPGATCIDAHAPDRITAAFLLGSVGYAIAVVVLLVNLDGSFDIHCGRGGRLRMEGPPGD